MTAVGPEDTALAPELQQKLQQESQLSVDRSQQLWDYRNRNTFMGLPVAQQAQDLLVDKSAQLSKALQLNTKAGAWTGYISPLDQDKKYLQEYTQLKQKEQEGFIMILQENTQFCPSLNKFLVFITYMNVQLGLNPRYSHLKEDNNGR